MEGRDERERGREEGIERIMSGFSQSLQTLSSALVAALATLSLVS
jgi:hypothetical protein